MALLIINLKAQDITNIGKPVNTSDHTEYAPTISSDGKTMILESDQSGYWKLYETKKLANGKWSEPVYIEEINDTGDEADFIGGPFLTYDDNYIYYTSDRNDGIGGVDIWYSKKQGKTWSNPKNLGRPINTSNYDGFPSVSPDGHSLYFMRDAKEPSVKDGNCYAIYVSHKIDDGSWGPPEMLPEPINTGCDGWPRIMADNKTLIFSSKRGNNTDNFDLYKTELQDDGTWSKPKPFTFANTDTDDKFVSIPASGDIMYFTVETNGNEDIYFRPVPKDLRQKNNITISGTILDIETKKPVQASLTITNIKTNEVITIVENDPEDGTYMVVLSEGADLDFSASAKGYSFYSEEFDLSNLKEYKDIEKNIELVPLKLNSSFVLNSIIFDNDKWAIRPASIPELNKVVKLLKDNSDLIVEISAHTDALGSAQHNQVLSDNRAKSVVDYLISKGINKNRLIAKGYGSKFPKYPNDTEANMSKNRRVEFKIVNKQ
jgi:OmpA-OmpF porin, OOP family